MKYLKVLCILSLLLLLNYQFQVQGVDSRSNDPNEDLDESQIVTINQSERNTDPSLILTENGFMMAFASKVGMDYNIYITKSMDGINWTPPIPIVNNITYYYELSLIEFNNNFILIFETWNYNYWDYSEENHTLFITISNDGNNWSSPKSILKIYTDYKSLEDYKLKKFNRELYLFYTIIETHQDYTFSSVIYYLSSFDGLVWTGPIETYLIFHGYWGMGNLDSYINSFDIIQRDNGSYLLSYSTTVGLITESLNLKNWSKPRKYAYEYDMYYIEPFIIETIDKNILIFNNYGIWKFSNLNNWTKISDYIFYNPTIIIEPDGSYWVANITYKNWKKNNTYWKTTSAIHFYQIPKPQAKINSIYPKNGNISEEIYFKGNGEDYICGISSYNWRSSIDGLLSNSSFFNTSILSVGEHTIYFKVQNDLGLWSDEVNYTISVNRIKKQEHDFLVKYRFTIIIIIIIILSLVILNYIRYKKKKGEI